MTKNARARSRVTNDLVPNERGGLRWEGPMFNLLTGFDDALLVMAEIEGYPWLSHELEEHPHCHPAHVCVKQALRRLHADRARNEEYRRDPERNWLLRENDYVIESIYGSGGYNRWMVRLDGRIALSWTHATNEDRSLAMRLGVEIFGGPL